MTLKKETIKRYLISSLISFVVGFSLVMVNEIESITLTSFKDGTLIGVLFMSVSAGIKAILELILLTFKK